MGSHNLPPSYSEVFANQAPSAPEMENSLIRRSQLTNPAWNPNMNNQQPQFSTAQPVFQQPQPQMHHQPQMYQQPQQTIIISQHLQLGNNPVTLFCPHCKQQSMSKITYETGWVTHMIAGVLCIIGFCPCACIPYCVNSFKDPKHSCIKCNGYIGMGKNC